MVFQRASKDALEDFLRVKLKGNSKEQRCQHEENPVCPSTFSHIYILYATRSSSFPKIGWYAVHYFFFAQPI